MVLIEREAESDWTEPVSTVDGAGGAVAAGPGAVVDPLEGVRIAAALEGDGSAFRALVEPHLPMLFRIAARVSGDGALAEDAVQETLALAYRQLSSYRHRTSFKSYLAAIVSRRAHTLARSERRRHRREQGASGADRPATPEEDMDGAALADRIRQVLGLMPKKRRAAALLRFDAGLSYREIANALGTTEGSARVLVHMVTKELRERLADVIAPPSPRSPGARLPRQS